MTNKEEMVIIDYFDRIHNTWIKVEVTKEVANFLKADEQKTRRKQNQYDFHNIPSEKVFNENHPENDKFLIDNEENIEQNMISDEEEKLSAIKAEHGRTLIQNSLCTLTPEQREVVEMVIYENLSYGEIGKRLGISKTAVCMRMKNAEKNIKKFIKNTEK